MDGFAAAIAGLDIADACRTPPRFAANRFPLCFCCIPFWRHQGVATPVG